MLESSTYLSIKGCIAFLSVEVYPSQAKLSKQLTYANNLQIGTVILYGPDEEKKKEVVVRYMKSRNQVSIGIDELITHIESER